MSALKGSYEVVGIDRCVPEGQKDLAVDLVEKEQTLKSIVERLPVWSCTQLPKRTSTDAKPSEPLLRESTWMARPILQLPA